MSGSELYFLEKVREFKKVEKEFIRYTYESRKPKNNIESNKFLKKAIELSFKALSIRNKILGEMHDVSNIQIIDPDVKLIISKLRSDERFESVTFAESIANLINKDINNSYEQVATELIHYFSEENYDEFWDDFHSWFYVPEYYYRKAQVGAIITRSILPKNIIKYFDEIKEAYAFGLDKSCISLSRTLLEIALHDKLKKKGLFKKTKDYRNYNIINLNEEDPLRRFIVVAKRNNLLSVRYKELADEIRTHGNNVLHVKDTTEYSVSGLALKTIINTVEVIEYLYR